MDQYAGVLAAVVVVAAGCGDPLFVSGDLPGVMRIVAGVPNSAGGSIDSLATLSRLRSPMGVAVSPEGILYIADQNNARILSVTSAGRIEILLDNSGLGAQERILRPSGLAANDDNQLLFTDAESHRVWKLELSDRTLTAIAGTGERGFSEDGTPALEADLEEPFGIAAEPSGRIYFSERGGHRVRTIEPDGSLTTVAGTGDFFFGGDGGPAAAAGLNLPAGLAIAGTGLYIADSANDRIRTVDLETGLIETVAGNGVRGFAGDGGAALGAALNRPLFVSVSADAQTLFISDAHNHRIRAVDLPGGTISTFAGTGDQEFSGELLDAGATGLDSPTGLAASSFDLLFIADSGHHIVWRVAVRL